MPVKTIRRWMGTLAVLACGVLHAHGVAVASQVAVDAAATQPCDLSGIWALRIAMPVRWPGNAGIEAGAGMLVRWARAERRHGGPGVPDFTDTLVPCGSAGPATHALARWGGETYASAFDDALFDEGTLPAAEVAVHLGPDAGAAERQPGMDELLQPGADRLPVGSAFTAETWAMELGVALGDAERMAWPTTAGTLSRYLVDDDRDGMPGVSLITSTADGAVRPPVDMRRRRRARAFHLAMRDLFAMRGQVVSCARLEGWVELSQAADKLTLQSRILGCTLEDGDACSRTETALANMFAPAYELDGPTRATWVRVSPSTGCREIRDMAF